MSKENNQTQETKKPMYIQVTEHQKFEKLASTTMETTQRIAKRINALFLPVFADYHGAVVYSTAGNGNVNPNQQFMVELHFKPMALGSVPSDGRVRAFKPIEEGTAKSDVVAGLKNIYGSLRTSAKFQLTEEASQILSEFMLPGINVDPFKPSTFDACKAEYLDTPQYGQTPIMVKVLQLDLTKLIRKIYGSKSEEGKRVDYGIIPYGPVMPTMNNQMQAVSVANWRVVIMQIDAEKTFDIASEFGLIPSGNGSAGPIVTGTI